MLKIADNFTHDPLPEQQLWAGVISRAIIDWDMLEDVYDAKQHAQLHDFFFSNDVRDIVNKINLITICEHLLNWDDLTGAVRKRCRLSKLADGKILENERKYRCKVCGKLKTAGEMSDYSWTGYINVIRNHCNKCRNKYPTKTARKIARMHRLIDNLENGDLLTVALRKADVSESCLYLWRHKDEDFPQVLKERKVPRNII